MSNIFEEGEDKRYIRRLPDGTIVVNPMFKDGDNVQAQDAESLEQEAYRQGIRDLNAWRTHQHAEPARQSVGDAETRMDAAYEAGVARLNAWRNK